VESTPNLNNVLIEDNEVFSYQRAYGGGIACEDDSYMYLNNVTIKNNEVWNGTRNLGGGIYITDSSAELYNVVITDNSIWGGSSNDGAGIYCNFELFNYPNPFNPTTTISFSISDDSKIELSIFNIKGQKVKELLNDQITAGEHSIIWNGEDVSGKKVGSGVYLYKLKINDKTEIVKKCMLLK